MKNKPVVLSKKQTLPIEKIVIPDLWEIAHLKELEAYTLGGKPAKDLILECWHIAHALKKHIETSD